MQHVFVIIIIILISIIAYIIYDKSKHTDTQTVVPVYAVSDYHWWTPWRYPYWNRPTRPFRQIHRMPRRDVHFRRRH